MKKLGIVHLAVVRCVIDRLFIIGLKRNDFKS